MTDEQLLTTGEIAKQLRVDPATVRRWAREGRIPWFPTPGGHTRFRLADVRAALIEANKQP